MESEYLRFILIVVASIVTAFGFRLFLNTYVKRITEKTQTDTDDIILSIITTPAIFLIVITGIYFAINSLTFLERYFLITDRIYFILVLVGVTYVIAKVLSFLVGRWLHIEKKLEKTPKLITRVVAVFVYLIAFLMVLKKFNVEITPLIATLGIGGLAIGLALQSTLSNFFAGLNIISDTPFRVGDFIELNDAKLSGFVDDIGWRTTKIITTLNTIVVIPNSKIAESIITNHYLPEFEMAVQVQCGVSYEDDLARVEEVTLEVARAIQNNTTGAVRNVEPLIRFVSFGDSNINFVVTMRVEKATDRVYVIHEFIKALKARYDAEKIEISWPVRKIFYGNSSNDEKIS